MVSFGNEINVLAHPEKALRQGEIFAPILRLRDITREGQGDKRLLPVLPQKTHLNPTLSSVDEYEFELVPGVRFTVNEGLLKGILTKSKKPANIIGEGSFATIVPGWDTKLDRAIVYKVFAPTDGYQSKDSPLYIGKGRSFAPNFKDLLRFYKEARVMANLAHPHIAKVHELTGFTIGDYFLPAIVMDRYDKSLLLFQGKEPGEDVFVELSKPQLTAIARQIGNALDHIHKHFIFHLDVKPGNIFMNGNEQFVLSDFGIVIGDYHEGKDSVREGIIGTEPMVAPEQYLDDATKITAATDQHGFAITLYLLLGGSKLPYKMPNKEQLRDDHIDEGQSLVHSNNIPSAVYDVLSKGISWKPEDRHPSCGVFAEAFIDALGK